MASPGSDRTNSPACAALAAAKREHGRQRQRCCAAGLGKRPNRAHGGTGRRRFSLDRAFAAITVSPTVAVMVVIFGIPLLFSLYLSFTGWALDQALRAGFPHPAPTSGA
jgi:hypothetical protein